MDRRLSTISELDPASYIHSEWQRYQLDSDSDISLPRPQEAHLSGQTMVASLIQFNSQQEDGPPPPPSEPPLPKGPRLWLIVFFACIGIFLQAIDSTIISTAIPTISGEFDSIDDVGWYGSAYMLTMCAFQIFWGRLYTFYDLKWTYIVSILIFELGSLICAVAPDSPTFIGGRAVAGAGGGGVFAGSFITVAFSVPLEKRPLYASYLGAMYGVASAVGPPLGGAFTDNLSWRGCFYMNLPLGAIVIAGLIPFFTSPTAAAKLRALPTADKLRRLDPVGTALFVTFISCLLIACEWGGRTYAWSNARIIVLLIVFAACLIAWVAWQIYLGDIATVPGRVLKRRSMPFTMFYSFTQGAVNFSVLYYMPMWFQAVKGVDAVQSGIDTLPFVIGLTVTVLFSGWVLSKRGCSAPFMLLSVALVSTACGLFTTWTPASGSDEWIGHLALFGLAQGFGWQQPILVAQTVLPAPDIPTGTSLTTVCKLLGGALFVSVGENVFSKRLGEEIVKNVPSLDAAAVRQIDATELRQRVDAALIPALVEAYNTALRSVWWICVGLSVVSVLGALGVEWRSVKNKVASGPTPSPPEPLVQQSMEERFPHLQHESGVTMANLRLAKLEIQLKRHESVRFGKWKVLDTSKDR